MPWISLNLIGAYKGIRTCCWQNYDLNTNKSEALIDIWNGEKAIELRKLMINGKIGNICPKSCPIYGFSTIENLQTYYEYVLTKQNSSSIVENLKKVMNEIKNQKLKLSSKPIFLEIYKPHTCNIECIFCWEKKYANYNLGINFENYLDFNIFFEKCKEFTLLGGEPLITWKEEIKFLLKNNPEKDLFLNTNGIHLNEFDIQNHISQFRKIVISLNAASSETYKKITGAEHWNKIINNIKTLIEAKIKKGIPNPEIVLNMIIIEENWNEIPNFINLSRKLGCGFNLEFQHGKGYQNYDFKFELPERSLNHIYLMLSKLQKKEKNNSIRRILKIINLTKINK